MALEKPAATRWNSASLSLWASAMYLRLANGIPSAPNCTTVMMIWSMVATTPKPDGDSRMASTLARPSATRVSST
ncbi:hypothetical protein D3C81_1964710 [compost metagenome]